MERRAFLRGTVTLFAAPLVAEAQQAGKAYRIGVLASAEDASTSGGMTSVRWLGEFGYVEGKNLRVDYRSAVGRDDLLPAMARELVHLSVDVIVCAGETAARAAKGATSRIPIVMLVDGDPVRSGLVTSLGRPGGNITGMTSLSPALNGKRLELLQQAVPNLARVAVLHEVRESDARGEANELEREADALKLRLHWLDVRRRKDFEPALKAATQNRDGAMLVLSGRVQFSQAPLLARQAAKNRMPALYPGRYYVQPFVGGLMSFGPDQLELSRRVAVYIDRVLHGTKPGDIPVEQPTRFEFVINLRTAKGLGLTIPPSLLARADQVIE